MGYDNRIYHDNMFLYRLTNRRTDILREEVEEQIQALSEEQKRRNNNVNGSSVIQNIIILPHYRYCIYHYNEFNTVINIIK